MAELVNTCSSYHSTFHLGEIDDIGGGFLLWKHTESFYTSSEKISLSRLTVTVAVAGTLNTAVTKDSEQKCAVLFRRN